MKATIFNRYFLKSHTKLTGLLLFLPLLLLAQTIDIKWIANKPTAPAGVSWGVPFEQGKIKKNQSFRFSSNSSEIPLQSWPLAYWPDGTVKWMGFAATVSPADAYLLQLVNKPKPYAGITVTQSEETIQISNGNYRYELNRSGKNLIRAIKINGKTVTENGKLVCVLENREKQQQNILSFDNFESEITTVEAEQNGPVRAVIKLTGIHRSTQTNREFLPFVVRLYFYYNLPQVRLVHSFVFDGNQEQDFIKGLGLVFDVPLREQDHNKHIRFSGENGGLWNEAVKPLSGRHPFSYKGDKALSEKQFEGENLPDITDKDTGVYATYSNLPSWNDYKLTQLHPNGFSISKRTNNKSTWLHADDGKRASGLALVGDISGGLAVSLKDFWQSYPASLEVNNARTNNAQLKIWLWSAGAEAMDLRHYDTVAHDLNATYEDVQEGLSTPYGIARTSELTLYPFDKLPTKQETLTMANTSENTPQLVCTPQYLHATKAFGSWSLPDKSNPTKAAIENRLDSSVLYYQQAIDERHWYGFWNYGDVMHSYDPFRHVWKYDIGGFAWDNTELAPNSWLWYSFLRSGRADIYKMAEAMTRHTSEVDAYHLGEMKGLGSRHNVSHWGCGSKEARIGQAAWKRFYYYLTTDERSGDLMREALDVEKALVKFEPLRIAQPREKFPYGGPMRLRWGPDWLAMAGNWMTEWERTGDLMYRDKIRVGLESLTKLPDNLFTGTGGLSYDPVSGKLWYDGKPNATNSNHLSTIMGGYEMLTELIDIIDYKPFRKTFTEYCRFYSMDKNDPQRTADNQNWGDIGFRTPRLTAFAAKELNDDKLAARAWEEFMGGWSKKSNEESFVSKPYGTKLITTPLSLNPVHENSNVGTNGTAQWGLNAIFMLELIGDKIPDSTTRELKNTFTELQNKPWKTVFEDDFTNSWKKNWMLDGKKALLKNGKNGLLFKAGSATASDADHAVLWTKQSFEGNLRIEFDFVRKDTATKFVNILYLFAEGSGAGVYNKDISTWNELRAIPAMKTYFDHISAYHISFAAFENNNTIATEDYIRARRYRPETGKGLEGTALKPEYLRTGFFKHGLKHHITIIKSGKTIYMQVENKYQKALYHWPLTDSDDLHSGRIGLRLMGSRISEFSNFRIAEL